MLQHKPHVWNSHRRTGAGVLQRGKTGGGDDPYEIDLLTHQASSIDTHCAPLAVSQPPPKLVYQDELAGHLLNK